MTNDWKDIEKEQPDYNAPCEYVIEVRCCGWYKPDNGRHTFAADDRQAPIAHVSKWKPWEKGEEWEKGKFLVKEFREKQKKQKDIT